MIYLHPADMDLRIEFDYQIFSLQKYGGISRYFSEVALRLAVKEGVRAEINCPLFVNEYLRGLPAALVRGLHVDEYRKTARARHWLNSVLSRTRSPRDSIRHLTYYRTDWRRGQTNVVTVYDMAHERFPGEFPANDRTSRDKAASVERADAVICISRHTRKELLELLPIDPGKVFVTHLGFTPLALDPGFRWPAGIADQPFLLYVGNRGGYKNFDRLLSAYGAAKSVQRDYRLLCLGGGPFTITEAARIKSLGLGNRVIQSHADDAMLGYGYSRAAAFLYPSVYEGFGIPPLEAMSAGCPVICGLDTSLAEVVGDAAHIINPHDEGSLAAGMQAVLESQAVRDGLVRSGRERAALFSWDKCAEETLRVYQSLGKGAG